MLTLHYNGQQIPTGGDFSLRMEWVNPVCFMDSVPGNAGLGIDIPVNDHSRTIFGNPHRFEKHLAQADRSFPGFEVRFSGVLLLSGTLNITNATTDKYSGWLQSELGTLGQQQRDRFLPDLEWKKGVEFQNKEFYDAHEDEYCPYPILNGAFWNGKGRETAVVREYTDEDGQVHQVGEMIGYLAMVFRRDFYRMVNFREGGTIKTQDEGCVVSPFLYLRYVIREMLRLNRFFIDRNDMINTLVDLGLEKFLVLYHNFNIMQQFFFTNPFEYTYFDHDLGAMAGRWESQIYRSLWFLEKFDYHGLLPRVSMKDFLLGLQNYLNYVFVFRSLGKVDIIDRNAILEGEAFDLDPWFSGDWIIGERKSVTLKFISEFDKEDRMFGQQYHDLTHRRADFKEAVWTFTDLEAITSPEMGELRLVKDENRIYEYKWKVLTSEDVMFRETQLDALGWEFISSGPQPFVYGDSDQIEEIKTAFSTLQQIREGYGLPVVLQQGNLEKMKNAWVDFTPRLINTSELLHPGALYWEGENGLFQKRWKHFARFWANRHPVEGEFSLPLNVLYHVTRNITGKFRTVHGEFIIETVETEFGSNMVGHTRIKGYKL